MTSMEPLLTSSDWRQSGTSAHCFISRSICFGFGTRQLWRSSNRWTVSTYLLPEIFIYERAHDVIYFVALLFDSNLDLKLNQTWTFVCRWNDQMILSSCTKWPSNSSKHELNESTRYIPVDSPQLCGSHPTIQRSIMYNTRAGISSEPTIHNACMQVNDQMSLASSKKCRSNLSVYEPNEWITFIQVAIP